ncbi:unnamed protein product [Amoebophrya sp. A25]|nr:unnamed protein product [Amoebophrya sp. A25]|eukprot:GSA25T00011664001.1
MAVRSVSKRVDLGLNPCAAETNLQRTNSMDEEVQDSRCKDSTGIQERRQSLRSNTEDMLRRRGRPEMGATILVKRAVDVPLQFGRVPLVVTIFIDDEPLARRLRVLQGKDVVEINSTAHGPPVGCVGDSGTPLESAEADGRAFGERGTDDLLCSDMNRGPRDQATQGPDPSMLLATRARKHRDQRIPHTVAADCWHRVLTWLFTTWQYSESFRELWQPRTPFATFLDAAFQEEFGLESALFDDRVAQESVPRLAWSSLESKMDRHNVNDQNRGNEPTCAADDQARAARRVLLESLLRIWRAETDGPEELFDIARRRLKPCEPSLLRSMVLQIINDT